MSSEFKGIAIVTGAAQGIGRAIALRLANDGFDVAVNDIPAKKDQLDTVKQEVNAAGRRALSLYADVSVDADVKGMVDQVVQELGGLDVMVANVGIPGSDGSVLSTSAEDWDTVFAINTRGMFLCYKYAAVQMVAQGRGGRIIGACSLVGKRGWPLAVHYSASKFALIFGCIALELGKHKITVNSYAPGPTNTPLLQALPTFAQRVRYLRYISRCTAVGHAGEPEDIAAAVAFLASKEAHFVTGELNIYYQWGSTEIKRRRIHP
ncbi:NAD(P)-binding protein [Leucogyrophana mollusca]|uniref:NAD(P)-binding protein n=1 Tax=Leucogyrophana mollusca TaxID=85980 RepID=A0ACB8BV50_9AGAM|nr:NAD(P)-binding protein [Leucogyrophana mollusca]